MPTRTPKDLQNDINRAATILEYFTNPNKGRDVQMLIPPNVLRSAHGIVFIRLYKIGFMLSAKSGTGIIIARLPDGSWSAPSGVSISSVGFGHQAGGEVIDSVIVMNYRAAVKSFYDSGGQLQLGMGLSVAAGPYGRAADVAASASSTNYIAATYAYSASKGLYAGYSFEGSKISERVNTNEAYYGKRVSAREILTGYVAPPSDATRLYNLLLSLGAGPQSGLPFAPRKSTPLPPHMASPHPYTPSFQPRPSQPTNQDSIEEPPPPYERFDSNQKSPTVSAPQQQFLLQSSDPVKDPSSPPFHRPSLQPTASYHSSGASSSSTQSFHSPPAQQLASYPPYSNPPQPPTQNLASHPSYSEPFQPPATSYSGYGESSSSNPPVLSPQTSTSYPAYGESSHPPYGASSNQPLVYPNTHHDVYSSETNKPIVLHQDDSMSVVIAKYDYTADQPQDLSFKAGDTIIVTKRLDDRQCWWEGEIGNRRGYFPANYTEDLTD